MTFVVFLCLHFALSYKLFYSHLFLLKFPENLNKSNNYWLLNSEKYKLFHQLKKSYKEMYFNLFNFE